jgi:hypothetical protein
MGEAGGGDCTGEHRTEEPKQGNGKKVEFGSEECGV